MDVNKISPFLDAVTNVMPQLGFQEIKRGRLGMSADRKIPSLGVMVIVGLTDQLRGNIVYNMTLDSAKRIASTMMMGMPVENFDAMAESAISELGNMLAANAATLFEGSGIKTNISPPTLIVGDSTVTKVSNVNNLIVELLVDDIPIQIDVALDR